MTPNPTVNKPANWIAGARLTVLQHNLVHGSKTLTPELRLEINELQKCAFPNRTRETRRRLLATLSFAPEVPDGVK